MTLLIKYLAGFAAVLALSMLLHDIFVFGRIRDRINVILANSSASELNPSEDVRKTLWLDKPDFELYQMAAFDTYRYESWKNDLPRFYRNKILFTPTWAAALWLAYDRRSIEAYRLWQLGAERAATRAFGKTLNGLSPAELDCVKRFVRAPSNSRNCPETRGYKSWW